ncbi:hypothetical protein AVEN_134899-1 [Araneus ventricosus]|uniref:Uncharacterized protein n=1 Tax=Araneus ventricosus TaxID=182803 RepID=A0A4Y2CID3_ARAVE|nr:hypothetical protein AVEN_134899-1 [Araneus ventricosus]
MQCVQMHCGDFCSTSACILWNLPDIERAPSVQIPTQFLHSVSIKSFKIANNTSVFALKSIGLQKSSSAPADIPSQNRTLHANYNIHIHDRFVLTIGLGSGYLKDPLDCYWLGLNKMQYLYTFASWSRSRSRMFETNQNFSRSREN